MTLADRLFKAFRTDNLVNMLTKFGTERSRTAHNRVGARRYLTYQELDSLQQMGLVQRVNGELPRDGARPFTVAIPDEPDLASATLDALDGLNVQGKCGLAGKRAREYGGAALWIVCEGGGAPNEPLDLSQVQRIKNLVLIDRFELQARPAPDSPSYFVSDPGNPAYGSPASYYYVPSQGGTLYEIHASRLVRFMGDDVPERLRLGWYDGWGAPAIEGAYNSFSQLWAGQQSGAELIQEFGHMIYTLDNLAEIMSGDRRDELSEWMAIQAEARSTLRATILGKGQSAERPTIPLSGWSDVFNELKVMFASEVGMPMSKLFQQGPGGLSTTDQNALADWSARVQSWQDEQYRPALNQVMTVLFASKQGPTGGAMPSQWEIEVEPYEVPTQREEAETTKLYADTTTALVSAGIMSAEDARETMRSKPGLVIGLEADQEADEGGALNPDLATPEGVSAQDTALNGAQISSMLEIIRTVWAGEISLESGVAAMMRALLVDEQTARELIGDRPANPAIPRTDAEDSYMPPKSVQDNARRALDVRDSKPASQRGMTSTGLARARDLSNGRAVSLDTVKRMKAYFDRHQKDKQGETWDEQGKGWQAWMGWGGDEGWAWSKSILERTDALRGDPYTATSPDLPDAVRAMPDKDRDLWARVFNAVLRESGDEATAFRAAYGAMKREA